MKLRLFFPLVAFTAAGCATAPAPKISAEEAFGVAQRTPALPVVKVQPKPTPEEAAALAQSSTDLVAALTRFAATARNERAHAVQGERMGPVQVENWRALNAAVDAFLKRPVGNTSSFDVIRARATAEAELEMDARAYGDMPSDLAEDVLDRVNQLALRMAEVRRAGVVTAKRHTAFAWPVEPVVVTSLFGRRLHPIARIYKQHSGIDLAAEEGQLVSSAADGVVAHAGMNGAHGIQVEVDHGGGLVTRYSHLSQSLVEPGLRVKKGDPLGLAGATGMATGVHLHFEVWRDGKPCDPLEELGRPTQDAPPLALLGSGR